MPYISTDGHMLESRSPWRLSFLPEMIWGAINFIVLFFQTLFNPAKNSRGEGYSSEYKRPGSGGGGPGGRPTRRMGGFRGGGGGPSAPPMGGGG